jgi:RimJ/RimL family protein N-acetyltransferase
MKIWRAMRLSDGEIVLAGDGLVLREWTDADVAAMSALFDEQSVDDWTPLESPFDESAARRYLDRALRLRQRGLGLQLAITTDGLTPLGEVLLFDGSQPGEAELAYAVGVQFRGRRLAARAMALLMDFARQQCEITSFRLTISPANGPSQHTARQAGFRLTGDPLEIRERKGRRLEMATWRC